MYLHLHSGNSNTRSTAAIVFCLALHSQSAPALADTFHLEHGGLVRGEWLNHAEQPLTRYLIRTPAGVVLSLPLGQVREAVRQPPIEQEYARRAEDAADTVADQWSLAEWCRQNNLPAQRTRHLQRTIELDPNHRHARAALGYRFLYGEWITREDFYRREGYEFSRGKWRTPQEIKILEERTRIERAEKDWLAKLRRWRQDLETDKAKTAYDSLAAIDDPVAVRPLAEAFARERVRRVKMLYADILQRIKTPEAVTVIAERTLVDPDDEIFFYCLDKLAEIKSPRTIDAFVAALKDANNARVNRAAVALAKLQDKSAISPLIDALVTTHTQMLPSRTPVGPGAMTTSFGDGGTFAKQNEGPTILIVHVQNNPVLDSLTKLTGASFGFDQKAWRYWHAQEKIALEAAQSVIDARR